MGEMLKAGMLNGECLTVSGKSVASNLDGWGTRNDDVIRPADSPLRPKAGFRVIGGNLFDSAIMKTSTISEDFQRRYLDSTDAGPEGVLEARAIVFEGPEDYHDRLNDPSLNIDDKCMLFMRYVGPVGYPGSAEVVNMQPPDHLIAAGVNHLPTVGDGRQSGTSESPSILNASPEAAAGGALAILETDDVVRLDLEAGTLDIVRMADGSPFTDADLAARWKAYVPPRIENETPWQEIYRSSVGSLATGGCTELATKYRRVAERVPRDNH